MPTALPATDLSLAIQDARRRSDALLLTISQDHWYERPLPQRHRFIFYVGHLEAFDFNQVCRGFLKQGPLLPDMERLFELGIDPEPGQLPKDTPADWPRLGEVLHFRRQWRDRVDAALADAPADAAWLILEHRLMHTETLCYMLHNVDYALKRPPVLRPSPAPAPYRHELCHIPAGLATLGQTAGSFGWDNEFPQRTVEVPAFRISKYKVTNGDYLAFVQAGNPAPNFWVQRNGSWLWRGMFAEIPLPLEWPVWVTYAQASAYAAWKGCRLMSEPEFHRAAYGRPDGTEGKTPWNGNLPAGAPAGNFNFRHWDPVPVTAYPAGASAFGVHQLIGNGWEWTSTPFLRHEGFQPMPTYPTYSANFFDEDHFVLKGGSPMSAERLTRRSFRNWFRRDYPFVYSGFRLVES